MVQIIDTRPDFIPEAEVIFFKVWRSPMDLRIVMAEWSCLAHAAPVLGGHYGTKGETKEARAAFGDAIAYGHEYHVGYMIVDDPEGLFPPEKRFES